MDSRKLREGFREAQKITKNFAKSFYLASLFLPKEKKYASYAVYAICRLSDETVDDPTKADPQQELAKLEQKIADAYTKNVIDTPLLAAFRHTVETYRIPKEYFDILIQGMRMDLELKRYTNFPLLYEYCYRVAGIVGLIMLRIFGCRDKTAEGYAVKLGAAMQLTNILRDISEDLARDRIYLPQEELASFGVSERQLSLEQNNAAFKNLLRFQIKRCEEFYRDSLAGVKLIDNYRTRFVVLLMQGIYAGILQAIQKNNFDVFSKRARVSRINKILIVSKYYSRVNTYENQSG